jgi:tetratricopeptide (TPR) repeat protein
MKSALVLGALLAGQLAFAQPAAKVQLPTEKVATVQAAHLRALQQAQRGDVKGAIRALQALSVDKVPNGEKDRVFMSLGRLDYEIGNYDQAIAAYAKVRKAGPNWLESLEETAWAQFREGHPEQTVALLKTVTSVAFKDGQSSEPYFLMGLAQLRVCDFKGVFKTIDLFKSRFGGAAKALESSKLASDQLRLKEIGESVQKLNLVEAETIQRLYIDENGKKHSGSTPSITRNSDQLSFPAGEDEEFWLDEVDGYKVSLKGCQAPIASKKVASASTKNEVAK